VFFGAALLVLWAATAAFMWRNHVHDPFNALLEGSARYGHNPPGALGNGLILISVEMVLAAVLVRPWSRPTIGSASIGLLFAAPWALCSMLMTMHAGGIIAIHFLWTVVLALFFVVAVIVSARMKVS